jgi:hypothetical protein
VVTAADLRYTDMRYGKAEGLCMDRRHVYIILDNNGLGRENNPEDKRPILLVLKRPEDK